MTQRQEILRIAFGVSFLLALSVSAAAELLVAGAKGVEAVAVGARFPDDHVFKLPAHSEVRVLKSPDNTLFIMNGPYEGTLSSFIESCSGVLAAVRSYCRGKSAGDQLPLGGTRGRRNE